MAEEVRSDTRKYEAVVVLRGSLSQEELANEVDAVKALFEKFGAEELSVADWGRKDIAYEVKKTRSGHYYAFEFASANSELNRLVSEQLRIRDSVLLFQNHRVVTKERKQRVRKSSGSVGAAA